MPARRYLTPSPRAKSLLIESIKGLSGLLPGHAQQDFGGGVITQGQQDVFGAGSAVTSTTSLLTGAQIDGPDVKRLRCNGVSGHEVSLLYLVCTD